jgi:hypothetical protein
MVNHFSTDLGILKIRLAATFRIVGNGVDLGLRRLRKRTPVPRIYGRARNRRMRSVNRNAFQVALLLDDPTPTTIASKKFRLSKFGTKLFPIQFETDAAADNAGRRCFLR